MLLLQIYKKKYYKTKKYYLMNIKKNNKYMKKYELNNFYLHENYKYI